MTLGPLIRCAAAALTLIVLGAPAIAGEALLSRHLQKTNGVQLLSLSPPQIDPLGRNQYVKFSLQCSFGEKVR